MTVTLILSPTANSLATSLPRIAWVKVQDLGLDVQKVLLCASEKKVSLHDQCIAFGVCAESDLPDLAVGIEARCVPPQPAPV